MREDWLKATVIVSQDPPAVEPPTSVWASLAHLVSRIEPPQTQLEWRFATYLIERVAWESLRSHLSVGQKTDVTVLYEWDRVLRIVETTAWGDLPARLLSTTTERPAEDDTLAGRVRRLLDSDATGRPTLAQIAREVGCSVRSMTKQFRDRYGMSVKEYTTRRRVSNAINLLVSSDLKVTAVAAHVGLPSSANLYRHFARLLNETPSSVRRDPNRALTFLRTLEQYEGRRLVGKISHD
jgi:AraC-like DNA-binding protein